MKRRTFEILEDMSCVMLAIAMLLLIMNLSIWTLGFISDSNMMGVMMIDCVLWSAGISIQIVVDFINEFCYNPK